jgi:hypothetical protein
VTSFSSIQYEWHADGAKGRPARSEAPVRRALADGEALVIPPYSMMVVHQRAMRPGAR